MKFSRLLTIIAVAFVAGCATDPSPVQTGLPPTKAENVQLLKRPPSRPYVELGAIKDMEAYSTADGKATDAAMGEASDVHARLREKAAALGADAVIIKDQGIIPALDPSAGTAHAYIEGIAIHFKAADQNGAVTASPPAGL
jgi:hypothetical protein